MRASACLAAATPQLSIASNTRQVIVVIPEASDKACNGCSNGLLAKTPLDVPYRR
jgi:hypothetical protein